MNGGLAARLGRPDLADNYGTFGYASPVQPSLGGGMQAQASVGTQASGQMTLGVLGAMVLGLLVFGIWTHKFHA